jgi:hypothetical protein
MGDVKSSEAQRLAQRLNETCPICLVMEDRFALVVPVHEVVDRAGT